MGDADDPARASLSTGQHLQPLGLQMSKPRVCIFTKYLPIAPTATATWSASPEEEGRRAMARTGEAESGHKQSISSHRSDSRRSWKELELVSSTAAGKGQANANDVGYCSLSHES